MCRQSIKLCKPTRSLFLTCLNLVALVAGCGGGGGAGGGNLYSCNDVKQSSPAANGDLVATRFCAEYTFSYTDPAALAQAIKANGAVCTVALSSKEEATWSTA